MGLLAVLDTFLVYKIAEYRHGRNVALFSSVIFAVMPLSWLLRRILLDSILLPFLLASILLAIYIKRRKNLHDVHTNDNNSSSSSIKIPIILLSGILLGLAIYTKIPAFTMIPLVGFLVYTNSNKSLKALGLWFLPVILIPAMWPVYSISAGQFDDWKEGILHQVNRTGISMLASAKAVFQIDPVIMVMGISGIILSVIKKDYIYLLWILPFAVLSAAIGYFQYFHVILLLPAISIGSGILLEVFLQISTKKRILQKYLGLTSILAITIFGLVTSSLLITTNVNNSYFDIYASVVKQITKSNNTDVGFNKFTVIGNHWWIYNTLWIPVYVFDKNFEFVEAPDVDNSDNKVMTDKGIVMIVDNPLRDKIGNTHLSNITAKYPKPGAVIGNAYDLTRELTSYIDSVNPSNQTSYPYNSLSIMIADERRPIGKIDIRTNY